MTAGARCKEKVAHVDGAMANTALLVLNLRICSLVVYECVELLFFRSCCGLNLCPCDNSIPYETTVVCKGEGGLVGDEAVHIGGRIALVIVACWLRMSACDLDTAFYYCTSYLSSRSSGDFRVL